MTSHSSIPLWIDHLHALIADYDAFLLDIWGVVHNGQEIYPHIPRFLRALNEAQKPYVFLTNAPRRAETLQQSLAHHYGLEIPHYRIISSGDITREYLLKHYQTHPKQIYYHLGGKTNTDLLSSLPIVLTDDLTQADALIISHYSDTPEEVNEAKSILKTARDRLLPAICANPDKEVPFGQEKRLCAGFFANDYESLGGQVTYFGKPHPIHFDRALEKLPNTLDRSRVIMIGDTLETDVIGAQHCGLKTALVTTGNMNSIVRQTTQEGISKAVENLCNEKNCFPDIVFRPDFLN